MKAKTFNILLLMASVVIALSSCKGTNSSSEPQNLGTSFIELTKTFLEKEPVQVITPSISDEKVLASFGAEEQPEKRLVCVQMSVSNNGKVYLSMTGTRNSSELPSEKFKEEVLTAAYGMYKKDNPQAQPLTAADIKEFGKFGDFGFSMKDVGKVINMSVDEREAFMKSEGGIPIESNSREHPESRTNEFQKYWLPAIKRVLRNHELEKDLREGKLMGIKAEEGVPFNFIQVVMENLQTASLNKFVLMTSFSVCD